MPGGSVLASGGGMLLRIVDGWMDGVHVMALGPVRERKDPWGGQIKRASQGSSPP